MAKFIVGLTGGIGSGKTTIANMFIEKGVTIVDADLVARKVVQPHSKALNQIVSHFGDEILLSNGELNRAELRHRIFANDNDKQWLNNLLHPLIRQEIIDELAVAPNPYCILVAPLLFENNLHKMVDRTLVVDVPVNVQIERTCARDNSDKKEVLSIINSQISRSERLALADDIIKNTLQDLSIAHNNVEQLDGKYRKMSALKIS